MPSRSSRSRGRPRDLTPRIKKTILTYIRLGSYIETAASAAGICRSTLYLWLERGANELKSREKGKPPDANVEVYVQFSEEVEEAMAESELRDLDRIDKAADIQWQASAWKLERRYPEKWGVKQKIQNENLNVDIATFTNEQLRRLAAGEPLASILASASTDSPQSES